MSCEGTVPPRARRPPRPHRFDRGDGSPDREREIVSVSVRTALRRAVGRAQTPQLTQRKRNNAVLALDTCGGRPSQLANPQLRAGSPAHHGLRARGGRRSAPRAGKGRSRNERSPSLLAVTCPAWPGSPRTPRTPVSPKFRAADPRAPRHLAPVPGRSEWAPRLQVRDTPSASFWTPSTDADTSGGGTAATGG